MGTNHFQWTSQLDRTIPSDDEVIPDPIVKPSLAVPFVNLFG